MRTFTIRTHILLLVLAVSIPLVLIVGLAIYSDMQQTIIRTKHSLQIIVGTMVRNTGGKISETRQILERLAVRPLVKRVDPGHCDEVLKDLLTISPSYANVAYANLEGQVVCSAVPQPGGKPVNVAKTQWLKNPSKMRAFR